MKKPIIPTSKRTSKKKLKASKESEPPKKWFHKAELEIQNDKRGCDDDLRLMKNR